VCCPDGDCCGHTAANMTTGKVSCCPTGDCCPDGPCCAAAVQTAVK
jgi:hypothetical protein